MSEYFGKVHCNICDSHEHHTKEHHTHGKHIGHEMMERGHKSFNEYFHKSKKERSETI